jgi:uncharacterized membrane protein
VSWTTRFRLRQYLAGSLWVLPLVGAVLGVVLGSLDYLFERGVSLPLSLTYSTSTASTLLSAIVGAAAALTGFVVTVTVLVVQMATGTFSARYMRLWYRDRLLKASLALLVGTLGFSFALLRRVGNDFVPNLGTSIAGLMLVICLLVFLVFLDRVLHRMRPVAVAVLVAEYVHRDYRRYEAALSGAPDIFWGSFDPGGESHSLVVRSGQPGSVQAVDVRGLLSWARQRSCLIAVRRSIGDFVPAGAVLFELFGDQRASPADEDKLRKMVVLGAERTIEQDPAFAIRIMVDIAERALSPAVNDPTTAVQVLNHLSDLLRLIGTVDLSASRWSGERAGRTGIVTPVRGWPEYLTLATTEIREYGANSIQVMRRMRAMLQELREEVLPWHRATVDDELARLDATVAGHWGQSIDLDRASQADGQGIGGRTPSDPTSAGTEVAGDVAGAGPS